MIDKIKLMELINIIKKDNIDEINITNIINDYRSYPQYIIKYLTIKYPINTAEEVVKYILETKERKTDIINCILSSYSIKVCETEDMKDIVCKDKCICESRDCWTYIYSIIMDILFENQDLFIKSYNLSYSLTTLIIKTDVIDDKLFKFVSILVKNPKNWKCIINLIRDAELYSLNYGAIIYAMRDVVVNNDRLDVINRNKIINNLQTRALLMDITRKYHITQGNISKITDNIYLTNMDGSKNVSIIKENNINLIITVTKKHVFKIRGIDYIQIMIDDIEAVNFIDSTLNTVDMVIEYIKKNYIILVHCAKGLSRSVCFVILLLIKLGMSFDDAYYHVEKTRIYIEPNPEFIRQIKMFVEKNSHIK